MTQRRRVRDDEEDLAMKEAQIDLENRDKREDQQRRMAWIAMISMIVLTVFLFLPIVSPERIAALADLLSMFYIAQAGIVAAFFGSQAYMSVTRS
jgi:hypothetical protein